MFNRVVYIVAIFLSVILQIVLARWLGPYSPELVAAGLLAYSLSGNVSATLWWAVLGGLMLDFTIGSIAGLYMIVFSILGYGYIMLTRHVLHQPVLPLAAMVFVAGSALLEVTIGLSYGQFSLQMLVPLLLTALLSTLLYGVFTSRSRKQEVIAFG